MLELERLFDTDAYGLGGEQKQALLTAHLQALNAHHARHCAPYRKIREANGLQPQDDFALPVQIFKRFELQSKLDDSNVKTLTSSGTTSQQVSKIFIDKQTSQYQTKALNSIMRSYLGSKRLPMIIVDTEAILKDRQMFSARGGGILGMSNFGRKHCYLFDENMAIRHDALHEFLEQHSGSKIFLFGFTFMVWHHLIKELDKRGESINIPEATLVHSGGWKKLEAEKVDNPSFKRRVQELTGIENVFNFYGMVEQMGSVYMECEEGHFHTSIYSDIVIRDPYTGAALPYGETGVIETRSILPHSYPGHIILTEDQGVVLGADDCACGRQGTYFKILGRLPKAEVRGCSDTYEAGQ